MIDILNRDLANEYKHMHFYLRSSYMVRGLPRLEMREFLAEQAASEMKHVQAFANLILGLGGTPGTAVNDYPTLTEPKQILEYALEMEREVVANYVVRQEQARLLGGVDGAFIDVFLDGQIEDSRTDADEIRMLLG